MEAVNFKGINIRMAGCENNIKDERFCVKTFGCQMNVYDSAKAENLMALNGYHVVEDWRRADVVFINTCSVREKAEQKAFSFIGRMRAFKKRNPRLVIAVGGCMGQRMEGEIFERFPFVDIVVGTGAFNRLPELVQEFRKTEEKQIATEIPGSFHGFAYNRERIPRQVTSMVTIMQGCDNFCTYCIVPFVRGRERSRSSKDIIEEINMLVDHGVCEVTLLGQNVNSYGNKGQDISFPELICLIAEKTALLRLRFTTSHPKDLSRELIECFSDVDILCHHIHLPVQAGSDRILKKMNRGYFRAEYLAKIEQLRNCCPDIALSTDVMVGFPGEKEEDFRDTLRLLSEVHFDTAFSFRYSDRPRTAASRFPGKIPEEIKAKRLMQLQELQNRLTLIQNKRLEGTVQEVLVEGESKNGAGQMTGRTGGNHIVNFYAPRSLIGKLVPVNIVEAYAHSLKGELLYTLGNYADSVKMQCAGC